MDGRITNSAKLLERLKTTLGALKPRKRRPDAPALKAFWGDAGHYQDAWEGRARVAADLLPDGKRAVCDIGCGPHQRLRRYLPKATTYVPLDLKRWDEHVLVCDLNVGILPLELPAGCDTAFVLGVCEYLFDVPRALRIMSGRFGTIIISYCPSDMMIERWHMWVNAFTKAEFVAALKAAGYAVDKEVLYEGNQLIFRAVRERGDGRDAPAGRKPTGS